jgi:hypothetical protein
LFILRAPFPFLVVGVLATLGAFNLLPNMALSVNGKVHRRKVRLAEKKKEMSG